MDIHLSYADMGIISDEALKFFKIAYDKALKEKGFLSAVITGGKSPLVFYEKLSADRDIDFSKITFFISDERVTDDVSELNYVSISERLFKNKKNYNFKRISVEKADAEVQYNSEVKEFLKKYKKFDISGLGIGYDGHVGSLFRNEYESKDYVISTKAINYKTTKRITLNYSPLNSSKFTVFIVSGKEIENTLRAVFS
jgi:6-phosphogluconolactonase/glucosamine-6-phosphate isomerase/deaminase